MCRFSLAWAGPYKIQAQALGRQKLKLAQALGSGHGFVHKPAQHYSSRNLPHGPSSNHYDMLQVTCERSVLPFLQRRWPTVHRYEPAPLCLEQTLPERCQHLWQTLTDGHPYVNWCLGCISEVFLSTPTIGYVDPWVFAYPYPHPHKPLPVRYGYGFGWVRVQVWVFYPRVTQVIH